MKEDYKEMQELGEEMETEIGEAEIIACRIQETEEEKKSQK